MDVIYFNEELGSILQTFRKSYGKTATSVAAIINKKAPYLSKLESGQIKKISSADFVLICNYISDSEHGVTSFIETAFSNTEVNYAEDTLITLINIDEVLYQFPVPEKFVSYLCKYITEHNIEIHNIVSEYNANKDVTNFPGEILRNMLPNLWYKNPVGKGYSVKLEVSENTINNFFSKTLTETNYMFMFALLYTVYKLAGITSEQAQIDADNTLRKYHIYKLRLTKHISKEDLPNVFGNLESHVKQDLSSVMEALEFILFISQNKGGDKRINTLKNNLSKDLGYTFAFISTDLSEIFDLSREKKKLFLRDLKKLVDEYSTYKETDIDLYFDE